MSLWHEDDGFFYDVLVGPTASRQHMRVRSMVGLLPILARAPTCRPWIAAEVPDFDRAAALAAAPAARTDGRPLSDRRTGRTADAASLSSTRTRLRRLLERLFDAGEFLSPFGIRSLSAAAPATASRRGRRASMSIEYEPGESRTGLFGGNSNWRGPIWFPVNVLLADKLRTLRAAFRRLVHRRDPHRVGQPRLQQAADDLSTTA